MDDDEADDDRDDHDDDFDYDEFISREFGDSQASTTLPPLYRLVAVVLVIVFALSLLYPLLFR